MPGKIIQNLFSGIPANLQNELCEVLCSTHQFRVEKIVSQGHVSPDNFWYDQETNEFVLLLCGQAHLEFADQSNRLEMNPGDWLVIEAHRKHRVAWTDPKQQTVWLAIHF